MLSTIALLASAPMLTAWPYYFLNDDVFSYGLSQTYAFGEVSRQPSQPRWSASRDAYTLKTTLPDMEPESISATLAPDGSAVKVTGKRKFEGCQCEPTEVREVSLPYRPRTEDVSIEIADNVLTLQLLRSSEAKVDAPTPLRVNFSGDSKQESSGEATRPLRFIPHPSATDEASTTTSNSVEAQEKSALDKFRGAAQASLAVSQKASTEEPVQDISAGSEAAEAA